MNQRGLSWLVQVGLWGSLMASGLLPEVVVAQGIPAAGIAVPLPLLVNGEAAGEIVVQVEADPVRLQAEPLLIELETLLLPELQLQLQGQVAEDGTLSVAELLEIGLEAQLDPRDLVLRVTVPPAFQQVIQLSLQSDQPPDTAAEAIPPSDLSGYANLQASQDFAWTESPGSGNSSLQLNLDGAVNLQGWVLEGGTRLTQEQWRRDDITLVRDDPEAQVRYRAGDVVISTIGFQDQRRFLGLSAERNFGLQPYRIIQPVGQTDFVVDEPVQVEIFNQGQLVRTLRLDPGSYNLQNLTFRTGINRVEIVITSDSGEIDRISFEQGFSPSLLAPGLQQFSYSLGVPFQSGSQGRTYDWANPTLSLSHRWGVSSQLTAGAYLQGDPQTQMVGVEGILASLWGIVSWDVALSQNPEDELDTAARLTYRFQRLNQSFAMGLTRRGDVFQSSTSSPASGQTDLFATYLQALSESLTTSIEGRYRDTPQSDPFYQLSLELSQGLTPGSRLSLNWRYQQEPFQEANQSLTLNMSWSQPQQSYNLGYEVSKLRSPQTRFSFNRNPDQLLDRVRYSLNLNDDGSRTQALASSVYTNPRLTLGLDHRLDRETSSGSLQQRTRLQLGTALAFADGHVAWSRPIGNSFALLALHPDLAGQTLDIERGGRPIARIDRFGPGVDPTLTPYRVSSLQISAPELPVGLNAGDPVRFVLPTYRSGTLIEVGEAGTIFARGILLDPQGNPVALGLGNVQSLDRPEEEPLNFFTNRVGRFGLDGLMPGRYQIQMTEPAGVVVIEVEGSQLVDLGTVQLQVMPNPVSPD